MRLESGAIDCTCDIPRGGDIDDETHTEAGERPAGAAAPRRGRRRVTVTFYLGESVRDRARAAYRSTAVAEQDASWSEMLTKALLAEVERREAVHNDGRRFTGGGGPLRPGRPISG